jgi:hypothetical protein
VGKPPMYNGGIDTKCIGGHQRGRQELVGICLRVKNQNEILTKPRKLKVTYLERGVIMLNH